MEEREYKVKVADISRIKNNPINPRVIRDDKFRKLVKSIQDFPEMLDKRPLVCCSIEGGKYMVLGGNMRLRAAQELKLKLLPIILADDWDEKQRKEFLIKDNLSFGEWDWEEIANKWDEDELIEWGMDIPKFPNLDEDEPDETEKTSFDVKVMFSSEEDALKLFAKLSSEGYNVKLT
jgi:ParB-like chromosome segregation protein Spo0J